MNNILKTCCILPVHNRSVFPPAARLLRNDIFHRTSRLRKKKQITRKKRFIFAISNGWQCEQSLENGRSALDGAAEYPRPRLRLHGFVPRCKFSVVEKAPKLLKKHLQFALRSPQVPSDCP
jgi:hypothetical protein